MLGKKHVISPFSSINYMFSVDYIFLLNIAYIFAIITCLGFLVCFSSKNAGMTIAAVCVLSGCDTKTNGSKTFLNIQWNPSCEATPFASEKWPFKRGGLSSEVEINSFMFRFTLSRLTGLSSGWPLKRGSTVVHRED